MQRPSRAVADHHGHRHQQHGQWFHQIETVTTTRTCWSHYWQIGRRRDRLPESMALQRCSQFRPYHGSKLMIGFNISDRPFRNGLGKIDDGLRLICFRSMESERRHGLHYQPFPYTTLHKRHHLLWQTQYPYTSVCTRTCMYVCKYLLVSTIPMYCGVLSSCTVTYVQYVPRLLLNCPGSYINND